MATTVVSRSNVPAVGPLSSPYSVTRETEQELDWAELVNLDLSQYDAPGGKEALAKQLKYAVHQVGFFYVSNFGISQEEVDYQFEISQQFFDGLSLEEKLRYKADHSKFSYNGYNGPAVFEGGKKQNDPRHNIESYFAKRVHSNVIDRLMVIFALVLELEDENYFKDRHAYQKRGEDHMRYMLYRPRSDEVNELAQGLYSTGHTDLGSITLLFRQPVAGLQVLNKDGRYRWVKAVPGTITVNIADTLSLLSGRYLKSSIHRVSVPPPDQRHLDRHGILFFIRPNNDVLVEVVKDSPLLQREGVYDHLEERTDPITVNTWVTERQKHIFKEGYKLVLKDEGRNDGAERTDLEAVIAGIKVKYWN